MDTTIRIWDRDGVRTSAPTESGDLPVAVAEPSPSPIGTVVLLHGRNGAPDQPHIVEIARAYLARGWRVAAPELPNSAALPQSGPASDVTLSGHAAASAGVWAWAKGRFTDAPVALAGHSLGGYAVARISADAPEAHHLLAVSPVLSGSRMLAARVRMGQPAVDALEREAPLMRAEMEREDATDALGTAAAPAAVVTGAEDGLVTLADARDWFRAAPNGRFFGSLPGEHHCPTGPAAAAMLAAALTALGA